MLFFSCFLNGFRKEFSYDASLKKTDVLNWLNIYVLQSLHRPSVSFHSLTLLLKTGRDEAFLNSCGNSGHILVPKFDTVSFPNKVVLMFPKTRWVPLLK